MIQSCHPCLSTSDYFQNMLSARRNYRLWAMAKIMANNIAGCWQHTVCYSICPYPNLDPFGGLRSIHMRVYRNLIPIRIKVGFIWCKCCDGWWTMKNMNTISCVQYSPYRQPDQLVVVPLTTGWRRAWSPSNMVSTLNYIRQDTCYYGASLYISCLNQHSYTHCFQPTIHNSVKSNTSWTKFEVQQ